MKKLLPGWIGLPRLDIVLLVLVLLVVAIGMAMVYSASGEDLDFVRRQAARVGVGLVAMLVLSQVPPHILRAWTPWIFVVGILLVAATWVFGVGRGAQRWLDFGLIRFQPSEIMKLAVPMMIAWYLHPRVLPPGGRDVLLVLCFLLAPAVLIARQPDLGTAMLVAASGGFTLFLAGLRWRVIAAFAAVAVAAAPVLWLGMQEYQRNRVRTFLDPDSDPLGQGWNIIQSKIAVGSGGLAGKGWLNGTQSRLEFIPERHTDFILAVLSEEFGFLGVCALLALYLMLIPACWPAAWR
jgi:rod shape determining protein RodA